MQTRFSEAQRRDPAIRESEAILRKCVHCGFCTATCPTYLLLGDELDGPRGRIYLIKDMLENDRPATAEVVRHIDRCLSCLACMTTCPSGVHYQHLVDHARVHIENTYRRPLIDRWMRAFLARVMPYPRRFARVLAFARMAKPLGRFMPARLAAALTLVPERVRRARNVAREGSADSEGSTVPGVATVAGAATVARAPGETVRSSAARSVPRVGVMTGCVQSVLGGPANAATFRLLERAGCETVEIAGCCGSLTHHLGRARETRDFVAGFIRAVREAEASAPLDAIAVNASGCGTHLQDLGFLYRNDSELAEGAAHVTGLARDITEVVAERSLPPVTRADGLRVAYHSACSMQHGQRLHEPPRQLLRDAGFSVVEIPEGHICCGSAGTYNMLQPGIAAELASRKAAHIATLDVDAVCAGNLGCITQLRTAADCPVVHTVELLDWATGGPMPVALEGRVSGRAGPPNGERVSAV